MGHGVFSLAVKTLSLKERSRNGFFSPLQASGEQYILIYMLTKDDVQAIGELFKAER